MKNFDKKINWQKALLWFLALLGSVGLAYWAMRSEPRPTRVGVEVASPIQTSLQHNQTAAAAPPVLPRPPLSPIASSAIAAINPTEVCGAPNERHTAADDATSGRFPAGASASFAQTRTLVLSSLRGSQDETQRALGLLLQTAISPLARVSGDACPADDCSAQVQAVKMGQSQALEQLVQQALATTSAPVYAMALEACRGSRDYTAAASCRQLSAENWARLDPGNAAPWLEVAAQANARGDHAALDDAMYRLARADDSRSLWGATLPQLAMKDVPAQAPLLGRSMIATQLTGIGPLPFLGHAAIGRYCAAAQAAREANRQQTCSAVAEMLLSKGRTLNELRSALTLGEQAGWPAQRVATLQQEYRAMTQLRDSQRQVASSPQRERSLQLRNGAKQPRIHR
jgi:hypothetical protein